VRSPAYYIPIMGDGEWVMRSGVRGRLDFMGDQGLPRTESRSADDAPWRASFAAHVYVLHLRVRNHELDSLGHVNNATYLNYLEQAAIDHAAAAGYDEAHLRELGGTFVARRHEIDYLRPALAGDWLRVTTWPVELGAARAVRAYQVARLIGIELKGGRPVDGLFPPDQVALPLGDVVVRARTQWAYVDVRTGRPRRMPAEIIAAFLRQDVLSR
jgi:acyl-CoA thioester hydrolase